MVGLCASIYFYLLVTKYNVQLHVATRRFLRFVIKLFSRRKPRANEYVRFSSHEEKQYHSQR